MKVGSVVESLVVTESEGHFRFSLRQRVEWVLETSEELLATFRPRREWHTSRLAMRVQGETAGAPQPVTTKERQHLVEKLREELNYMQMLSLGFIPMDCIGESRSVAPAPSDTSPISEQVDA